MTENIRFILASASPRRHDLLNSVGIPHKISVSDAEENPSGVPESGESYPEYYAREASIAKGEAVAAEISRSEKAFLKSGGKIYVISADTVVSPDFENVFGKPKDAAHAKEMLRTLSGTEHFVIGGITVIEINDGFNRSISDCVITSVFMKELTDSEIDAYIESGEPDGKAGAYDRTMK